MLNEKAFMTPQLSTRYVFTITALIGGVTSAGDIGHGVRRIIPVIGGEVRGEGINGKVCAFGADFQIIRPNELIELEAKYAFETDDGAVIYVENKGIRFGPVELLQRLKRGEPVDPKLIYFRTVPRFETGSEIPLADGIPVRRLGGTPCRPRRGRRASGAVRGPALILPWRGGSCSHRAKQDARRGGVKLRDQVPPHPAAHFIRVDPRASFARLDPSRGG